VQADQGAGNSSPPQPEVKPTEPKPVLPTFDINAYDLNTADGVKTAAAEFIKVLEAYPAEDRGSVFLASSGVMLVQVLRSHGRGADIKEIQSLGINLPPVEVPSDDAPKTGTSRIPFKGNEGAAA